MRHMMSCLLRSRKHSDKLVQGSKQIAIRGISRGQITLAPNIIRWKLKGKTLVLPFFVVFIMTKMLYTDNELSGERNLAYEI